MSSYMMTISLSGLSTTLGSQGYALYYIL